MTASSSQPTGSSSTSSSATTINHHTPSDSSPTTAAADTAVAPSSIWSRDYWTDLMDQQRLQRLEQCKILTSILDSCEAAHHHHGSPTKKKKKQKQRHDDVPRLDDVGPGLRMLMYYNWRNKTDVHQKGCIPERHSVWTCRAVALGCGEDLRRMKDCFDAEGIEAMLSQPRTGYSQIVPQKKNGAASAAPQQANNGDDSISTQQVPCWEFQRAVGQCVTQQGRLLAEKKIRWDKQSSS